jgi:2-methylisocitrate lyase-like PEP mutase family enzyme
MNSEPSTPDPSPQPLVTEPVDRSGVFRALHRAGQPLLMANPWDVGSARILTSLGFHALATTSSGFAATLGRPDGRVTRDEAIAHAAAVARATDVPVNADLENGFGDDPADVAETIRQAVAAGLAGASIEDYTNRESDPIYELEHSVARVAAAAAAAHNGSQQLVLTARAENHIHGIDDLDDTIERLVRYEKAGADVVYAPGLVRTEHIAAVIAAVTVPVNVLALPTAPPVGTLADLGVSRISIGGAFAYTALGALVQAGRGLLDNGTYEFGELAALGRAAARDAFNQ